MENIAIVAFHRVFDRVGIFIPADVIVVLLPGPGFFHGLGMDLHGIAGKAEAACGECGSEGGGQGKCEDLSGFHVIAFLRMFAVFVHITLRINSLNLGSTKSR